MRLILAFLAVVLFLAAFTVGAFAAVATMDIESTSTWSDPEAVRLSVAAGCLLAASLLSVASAIWWPRIDERIYAWRTRSRRPGRHANR